MSVPPDMLAWIPCVAHGAECDGSTNDCGPITTRDHATDQGHEHEIAWDLNRLPYCVDCWRGERIWMEPGDIAELTFYREETGEVEVIRALCIKPSDAGPGWVLADGTRLPLRPRPVIKCDIVYPPAHRASEIVIHPIPEPDEHTTQETDQHDRNPDPGP